MGASTAIRVCTCGRVSWLRYAPAQNDTYQAPPSSMNERQRVRAAILPRGRRGYAVPRVARVSPGCRARQRVWPRTLAKIRAHGRGWVKTGHFAGFAVPAPARGKKTQSSPERRRSAPPRRITCSQSLQWASKDSVQASRAACRSMQPSQRRPRLLASPAGGRDC